MEHENPLQNFRSYPGINEAWELQKTGLVVMDEVLYKLELWHSISNPDVPYYVAVYVKENGVWHQMQDAPFATGPTGDDALGAAMASLSERAA
ncbi:MAG TPA: hypothetical protein VFA76_03810 [Terriglobales bacterium]|nr:hypothetical protein [Terriglobales bacterium]